MQALRQGRSLVAIMASVLAACGGSPTTPKPPQADSQVLLAGLESRRLLVVDIQSGTSRVLQHGVAFADGAGFAVGRTQRIAFAMTGQWGVNRRVVAIDIDGDKEVWSEGDADGVNLIRSSTMSIATDETVLAVCPAERNSMAGIGLLDVLTGRAVGFIAGFNCADGLVAALPPSAIVPSGGFAAIGRRGSGALALDSLFVVDRATLRAIDSLRVPAGSQQFWSVTPAPTGDFLIIGTDTKLARYDFASHTITAEVARSSWGVPASASNGQTFFVNDPGYSLDRPSSGLLYQYSNMLQPLAPIDLRRWAVDGVPPTMGTAVSTTNQSLLLVPTGTTSRGPLYGAQRSRLVVIRQSDGTQHSIDLGDWKSGVVFELR